MYYMLVRLSVCLNHIKGTIIIIIINYNFPIFMTKFTKYPTSNINVRNLNE